ncbi:hypothetical protein [Wolbachia endosymbiont of Oedothorax gibbosus]|uniref:hypothetical protein n=1 Tax=Wolbachia endosymbiont of Oedothorax gibbosus TaxID=931100 RepID=UPI002023E615|nr:hypothetical protein [Wolbachia endosymbiont of Oedothorax gibbosus]
MHSPFKKPKSKEGDINQSLHEIIYNKVTKKTHNHKSPKKNGGGTIKKCIELFKQGDDPKVLTKLEKSLRERIELEKSPEKQEEYRKHYKYYIENFLPALLGEIMQSKNLETEEKKKIAEIISDAIKQAGEEEYERFQRFLSELETKLNEPNLKAIIMKLKISDDLSKIINENDSGSTIQNQNGRRNSQIDRQDNTNTPKLSSDSDSGVSSRKPSEENLESPVSSRRSSLTLVTSTSSEESLNSTLSSVEGDNGLQPEDEGETKLAHLTKTRSKGPSGRRSPSKYNKKIEDQVKNGVSPGVIQVADTEIQREKNMDPDGQATQMTGSQPLQPEEKKNTAPIVQKPSANKNNSKGTPPEKQPNNRNLHVALVAGCALSTIGCIVAGAMTSGLVGAGLLAMAAVFAIAAVAELHSNFLSSKLTSINVEPLVDDKELTACSRL